jgi:hypothetical protein
LIRFRKLGDPDVEIVKALLLPLREKVAPKGSDEGLIELSGKA